MKEARGYAAAAHHRHKGFLITGGEGDHEPPPHSSTEITQDGVIFVDFTPLPIALIWHCAVALNDENDGDFFVAGGLGDDHIASKRAFIHKGNQWNEMTEMPTAREGRKPSLEIENELPC